LKERIRREEYLAQKSFAEVWNDYARRTNPLLPSLQNSINYLFQPFLPSSTKPAPKENNSGS
jgi:hypothetical protein